MSVCCQGYIESIIRVYEEQLVLYSEYLEVAVSLYGDCCQIIF